MSLSDWLRPHGVAARLMTLLFTAHSTKITIIEPSLEGHRADQLAAIRSLFSSHDVSVDHTKRPWRHIFTRAPILFPTVDESFFWFLMIAPARALLLRRTVAIWHRPKSSTGGRSVRRWRRFAKYYAAKLIKYVPFVTLLSVQKPQFQPEITGLFTDWIHQIADWYQPLVTSQDEARPFKELIRQHAKGRPLIVYLGKVTSEKGFEFLTNILLQDLLSGGQFAFVAAGKLDENSGLVAHRFIKGGGLLVNRCISNIEFTIGIEVADWVWNCYPSDNDQNSGIFGIAYRAGARVIVRTDSYIARTASELQFPTVQIQYGDAKAALETIRVSRTLPIERPKQEMISMMRERTRERLLHYLGCPI
jgi:hypothetical protein